MENKTYIRLKTKYLVFKKDLGGKTVDAIAHFDPGIYNVEKEVTNAGIIKYHYAAKKGRHVYYIYETHNLEELDNLETLVELSKKRLENPKITFV